MNYREDVMWSAFSGATTMNSERHLELATCAVRHRAAVDWLMSTFPALMALARSAVAHRDGVTTLYSKLGGMQYIEPRDGLSPEQRESNHRQRVQRQRIMGLKW